MTNKYVLDESAHALHRVVGYGHTWEELAPGIRVRRRVVKPEGTTSVAAWVSTFSADFEGFLSDW